MLKDYPQNDIQVKLVIEGSTHQISGLDETDNYDSLRRVLERELQIPYQFQCLYYKKDQIPLGFMYQDDEITVDFPELKEGKPAGRFIDKSQTLIGLTPLKTTVNLLNFRSFIEDTIDSTWFRSLTDYELQEFLDLFVKRYWPFINLGILKNAQLGSWPDIILEQDAEISVRNIFSVTIQQIKKLKNYSYTYPTEVSKKMVTTFDSPQNLIYFFDQFKLNKKYYAIVIKINEAKKYKRFIEGNKLAELITRVPKLPGILINDSEIYIRPEGTVIHESDDILTEAKGLFRGSIVSQKIRSSYSFTVALPIKMNSKVFSKLLNSYGSFIERDYKNFNFEYFISFYYKKIDTSGDETNSEYIQSGSYIKIVGRDVLTVLINNVKSTGEIENIYNFLVRLFYVYVVEYQYEISLMKNEARIKSNLKDIDWKLFSQENLFYSKHTRLCQREKQPYGFHLDSEQYAFFKENPKNKDMIDRQLIMDNMTYPDKKSVYICPNKKYPFPTFISSLIHKNDICIPCCSSIDKRKSPEYQGCIGKNEVEIRDSNNLYYISQFNPEKIMKRRRLCYLPEVFHKMLNPGIKLKTFIAPGEDLFVLAGFETSPARETMAVSPLVNELLKDLVPFEISPDKSIFDQYLERGVNIVIIRLTDDLDQYGNYTKTPKYSLVNVYDDISILNNIQRNRTIYLLETRGYIYYPVTELILSKDRKYTIIYAHKPESRITMHMITVLNKIMKIESTLPYKNYSQIKGDIPFICNSIYIEDHDVIIPILPRPFNNNRPIIEPMTNHVNKMSSLLKVGLKIQYNLVYKNKLIGFELKDDGLIVFFKPESISAADAKIPQRQIYIDLSTLQDKVNEPVDLNMNPELFKVFEMEFASAINTSSLPKTLPTNLAAWNELLLKKYRTAENPQFVLDYMKIKSKKIDEIELFKKYKDQLLSTSNTKQFVRDFMKDKIAFINYPQTSYSISNIRKICSESAPYSVSNQCAGDRLQLTKEAFNKFTEMLAWELDHNQMKKRLILDNILPNIVSFGNFSYQKGTRILKL